MKSLCAKRPAGRAAFTAGALAAAAACFVAAPLRGQQGRPAVHATGPSTARHGADTRVTLDCTVPAGVALDRNPRFRVTDAHGQTVELLPAHVTRGLPAGLAYRDLHTYLYPPGVYQVRAEIVLAPPGVDDQGDSTDVIASDNEGVQTHEPADPVAPCPCAGAAARSGGPGVAAAREGADLPDPDCHYHPPGQ